MIKRSFCFHFVGAAICRPPKTQSVFPLYTALCAVTIAAKPRAKSQQLTALAAKPRKLTTKS